MNTKKYSERVQKRHKLKINDQILLKNLYSISSQSSLKF
ncbi:hypothetical protein CAMRE0001_1007 [Campylobacter rectus RM3267]|uniref:Uncharacterized protein n=1 Tax=Campylobacter rectus RM3267 TaxID=553218 RepID=B9D2R2_CAMRE|nr:hypothetical protein CAMRE0001_1007 [Campylobacter rectus RM3267]